jgi:hypothetical protein
MDLPWLSKKAAVGVDDTIKWIIWIAILIVAGLGIRMIVSKAIG